MKESNLVKHIRTYLNNIGAYNVKYHGGNYSEPGVPDLLACYKGIFFGLEAKVGYNKATEHQLFHLHKIKNAGGFAAVVHESNWKEQLDNIVDKIDKGVINEEITKSVTLPARNLGPS